MDLEQNMTRPNIFRIPADTLYKWGYPVALAIFFVVWATYMTLSHNWDLYKSYWPMPITMAFGSFVAGSTPQGGAAIAFPVFTKALHMPPAQARTFGLMIQSVGMVMASWFILTRRMPIMPKVILWAVCGSFIGMVLGTFWLVMPGPYSRILYTLVLAMFGIALFISRWVLPCPARYWLPSESVRIIILFGLAGLIGGIISAQTGSGVDVVAFIVLTLAFGIYEKISIPTTVIIMALTSLCGFFLHGVVLDDIGIVWNYWLVAAPVVAVGAPMGAYFAYRINRDILLVFILLLITAELITTILLVQITGPMLIMVGLTASVVTTIFFVMLRYRQRRIAVPAMVAAV